MESSSPVADTAWAMSQENVEVVRRAFEAALQRPPDFATVNELFDPDHVIATRIAAVEGRSLRGAAGFREWLNDMGETMESWEVKVTSLRDLGDGRVLASGALHATSKEGVPIEVENWFISTVRDGKIVRSQVYESQAQALEAAGLRE